MSLNFLLGFTGVLSFGHAAYFGLGAYGVGMTIKYLGAEHAGLAVLVGTLVGGIVGALIGTLIVRLRGVYFAMVTIAFGQVFYFIAFRWNSVTGGDDGLAGWQRQPLDFGFATSTSSATTSAFYYFVLACFAVAVGVMALLLRSPFGRTLLAIRENERRARFLGIPVDRHIWLSFVISCLFVSLAGTLYALLNNFADPRALRWDLSGNFVIMAVLGGMRSFWGPLIGAAIFVVLQDYVSSQTENWMSFIGLFFVLVVLFFPRGVLGIIRRKATRMSLLQVENVSQAFRQPGRRRRRVADGRAGRAARHHRPERRRQDHVLQPDQRLPSADRRARSCSMDEDITGSAGAPACGHGHGAHLPDHRGLSRAHRARQPAHRGRGRGRLPPAALACRATARRRSRRASTSFWTWAAGRQEPTGWSASCRTATSARPRS